MQQYLDLNTAIGWLRIVAEGEAITQVQLHGQNTPQHLQTELPGHALLSEAKRQLEEYFAGNRILFTLPLNPKGTAFQQKVWKQLQCIPYGKTCTYGQIAERIGNPKASRAVGSANHSNPIAILIPCHRVVGANGSLTGYAGGLDKKEALLKLEQQGIYMGTEKPCGR